MFHGARTVEDTRDYLDRMCAVANAASGRVLEKAGLARVATLDRHKYATGTWWTSHLYEIRR